MNRALAVRGYFDWVFWYFLSKVGEALGIGDELANEYAEELGTGADFHLGQQVPDLHLQIQFLLNDSSLTQRERGEARNILYRHQELSQALYLIKRYWPEFLEIGRREYERWPIKTHIITPKDDFFQVE